MMTSLKKACSEARPRADCRTRGRLRELFSVDSMMKWQEIRKHYPQQWLLVEAIKAHSEANVSGTY